MWGLLLARFVSISQCTTMSLRCGAHDWSYVQQSELVYDCVAPWGYGRNLMDHGFGLMCSQFFSLSPNTAAMPQHTSACQLGLVFTETHWTYKCFVVALQLCLWSPSAKCTPTPSHTTTTHIYLTVLDSGVLDQSCPRRGGHRRLGIAEIQLLVSEC